MFLVDRDVTGEACKREQRNPRVRTILEHVGKEGAERRLSAVTTGELRLGVERIRFRGDRSQSESLEPRRSQFATELADPILPPDHETAHVWRRLRVSNPDNPPDKQIAATALIHDLAVEFRNVAHYATTVVGATRPFTHVDARRGVPIRPDTGIGAQDQKAAAVNFPSSRCLEASRGAE